MKRLGIALGLAAVYAAIVAAEPGQTESKSKIEVKDGQKVRVSGCIEPTASRTGFMLTHVADKSGALHSYMLVADDADLVKHVGHRVEIEGTAADRGDGRIETETKTKSKTENGNTSETHSKSEVRGDLAGAPFLGVKSVKMLAAACN